MIPFTTCLADGGGRGASHSPSVSHEEDKEETNSVLPAATTTTPSSAGALGMKSSLGGWVVVTSSGHLVATSGVNPGKGPIFAGAPPHPQDRDSHKTVNQTGTHHNSQTAELDTGPRRTNPNYKRRGTDKSFYLRKHGPSVSKHPVYHPQQPLSHQPVPPFFGTDLFFLQQQRHLTPSPIICPSSSSSSSSQPQHSLNRLTSSFRQSKKTSSFRKAAYLDETYQGQTERLLENIHRWNFSIFTLNKFTNGKALSHLCLTVFHEYDLIRAFNLDLFRLYKCFSMIEEGYHNDNPYHNALHAADVCQAMHCYMREPLLAEHLTPLEILTAFLASVFHDVGHPGVNSMFLLNSHNHIAGCYKTSVLEQYHWRYGVSILKETGLLDHFEPDQRAQVEKDIQTLILATDICRNQEYLVDFRERVENSRIDLTSPDSRLFVLQIALKCADVSNPCRPWKESKRWSERVTDEFFQQGDFERASEITVTPLCDRFQTYLSKVQHGFMEYMCLPLFREWKRFNPSQLSDTMLENLLSNTKIWMEQMEAHEARQEKEDEFQKVNSCLSRRNSAQGDLMPLVPRTHLKMGPHSRRGSADESSHIRIGHSCRRGSGEGHPGRRGSGDETSLRYGPLNSRAAARRGSGDVDLLRRSLTHKTDLTGQQPMSSRPVSGESTSPRYSEDDSPIPDSNASLASSKASSRASSRASLTGSFIPSDFLPRRHSLPHVTSFATSGRPSTSDGFSTPPSTFVFVESLMQSDRKSCTTRQSITAHRRSSMPFTPSAQGVSSAHCKDLGIGNDVMARLHYIYGKALEKRRGSHVSVLSAVNSPSSSVNEALDNQTDSSIQPTLCSKSSRRGSLRRRGTPLSSHRLESSSSSSAHSSRNIVSKTFPLDPWMGRPRVTTLTPREDISRLGSLLHHRIKTLNPCRRFSRFSQKRFSLSGGAGGSGAGVAGRKPS